MITELSWLEEMAGGEEDTEDDADTSDHYICYSQEWISPSDDGSRRDDQSLSTAIGRDIECLGDVDLISASSHGICILSEIELTEGGKAGCPHPILKVIVRSKVWGWSCRRVSVRISPCPVWRRDDLIVSVASVSITIPVRCPRDSVLCHLIDLIAAGQAYLHRRANCVIELRIRNESARIVDFAILRTKRITITVDATDRDCMAFELILTDTLHVSSVVLVEVCKFVVEQDWRLQIMRNSHLYLTNRILGRCLIRNQHPGCGLSQNGRIAGNLEIARDIASRYRACRRRRACVAVRVVNLDILDSIAGIQ